MTANAQTVNHSQKGAIALHASAIEVNEQAILFLGPAGTGKTTIWQLLSVHTTPIADDVVYLVLDSNGLWSVANGGRRVHTGPLSIQQVRTLHALPLRAIFRLYQAQTAHIMPIDGLKTCRYLTDALFEIAWQRDHDLAMKRLLFSDLAAIGRSIPGYEFHFHLSPQTREVFGRVIGLN